MVEDQGATGVVTSRKWYWIAVGALCALGLVVAYLGRPEDELAVLRQFHPTVEYDPISAHVTDREGATFYTFSAPAKQVEAAIPGTRTGYKRVSTFINLPSGRKAVLSHRRVDFGDGRRQTCDLTVYDDLRPWYEQLWSRMRGRLGL